MKRTSILVFVAMVIALSFTDSFAGKDKLFKKAKKEARLLTLAEQITSYVQYSEFATKNNVEGIVRLSYVINEKNQLEVLDIQGANLELRDYVLAKINGKTVAVPGSNNKVKYLKLNFKLY
ncbi:MAG: hypothetical protein V4714_22960 [Bacteroidota bacterium]